MYLYELLEEERNEAIEHKNLLVAQDLMEAMVKKGYPEETIKRRCLGYSNLTEIGEAVWAQEQRVAIVQMRIRGFMQGPATTP